MNINDLLHETKTVKSKSRNLAAGAIDIAIRDAEIHGTKLAIKSNGKIEMLTPDEMRSRIHKS
ncbi:MAG: hypothetical protein ACRBDI_09470 [Alphaproteobacteria bacterium]